MTDCVHHWMIDEYNFGYCIKCHAVRQYPTIDEVDKMFSTQIEVQKLRRKRKRERDLERKRVEAIPQA